MPTKGGERAYALLREAIRESGRIGIAKFILRDAQHLAAVEVIKNAIVLSVMRFADELVDVGQFDLPADSGIRKPELDMAKALVNSLAAEWDPAKYTDEYRENLLRLIKGKVKGKKVDLEPVSEPRQAQVVDLMGASAPQPGAGWQEGRPEDRGQSQDARPHGKAGEETREVSGVKAFSSQLSAAPVARAYQVRGKLRA